MKNFWSVHWRIFVVHIATTLPIVIILADRRQTSSPYLSSLLFGLVALVLALTRLFVNTGALSLIWGGRLSVEPAFWKTANRVFILVYIALAISNAAVAYAFEAETWKIYKSWIPFLALIITSAYLGRQLQRHIIRAPQ